MPEKRETILRVTYDVEQALKSLQSLETRISNVEQTAKKFGKQRASAESVAAKEAIRAEKERSRLIRRAGMDAIKSTKQRASEEKRVAAEARKTAKQIERQVKAAKRTREEFRKTFLAIGQGSQSGFGAMAKSAAAAAIAVISLHRLLGKIGEAKDRYLRFDEITTATLTITNAGEAAFEHGARGAERYRDAVREAANEVKVSATEMADSAHFWAKAGQKNAQTIAELSKVGALFARANRDAENNILDQARANDLLSDALTLFRKDTSTPEKATAAATEMADQFTAAANAANMSVEQLFEFSKKAAPLAVAGEISEKEVMAIAGSLASAGLKAEEPGRLIRRILTQFARDDVQKKLRGKGVEVTDEAGNIRGFGDIFGDLGAVMKEQAPLERLGFLKDIVGQNAISVAAALAGLNEQGMEGQATSIKSILDQIEESNGVVQRNQDQYLETTGGRIQALTSTWENAFDEMLEQSGIIEKIISGLEGIDAGEFFEWVETDAIPALQAFGTTLEETIIPGIQMTASSISEWLSPAISMFSGLLSGVTSNAEDFSDTLTTIVKMWVRWRVAMLAIRGLRMVDWLAKFVMQAKAAAAASKSIGTATEASVAKASTSVSKLPAAFSAAGVGIAAAIAAWGLADLIMGPVIEAEKRLKGFYAKYGDDLRLLNVGEEKTSTLLGRLRDLEKVEEGITVSSDARTMMSQGNRDAQERRIQERKRLRDKILGQIRAEYGVGESEGIQGRVRGGKSEFDPMAEFSPAVTQMANVDVARSEFHTAINKGTAEAIATAQDGFENALNAQLDTYQVERSKLEQERDATYDRFVNAQGDERKLLIEQMDRIADQLKDNADAIGDYTSDLDEISGNMARAQEREKTAERAEEVSKRRRGVRQKAFQGGKTKPLNPFATPLLSGMDPEGNRVVNLALQKGNAAEYYKRSPEARQQLMQQLKQNKNIVNVNFGDATITVTAKSDAKPRDIAKAVKDEWWKIGERQRHDVERVLGSTVPAEI